MFSQKTTIKPRRGKSCANMPVRSEPLAKPMPPQSLTRPKPPAPAIRSVVSVRIAPALQNWAKEMATRLPTNAAPPRSAGHARRYTAPRATAVAE